MAFDDLAAPIGLTLALAAITTLVLLAVGVPIAWGLARWRWGGKEAVAAVLARKALRSIRVSSHEDAETRVADASLRCGAPLV